METHELNVEPRLMVGKSDAKRLRKEGKVPGVLYGEGETTLSLVVNEKEFRKLLAATHGSSAIITLKSDTKSSASATGTATGAASGTQLNGSAAIIREIQLDYLSSGIQHIDFLKVSMEKEVEVVVPLHVTGKAKGLEMGGVVNQQVRQIKVKCLPKDIPAEFVVDVTPLNIGDVLLTSDIALPKGVTILGDLKAPIVSVVPQTKEEGPFPVAAAEAVAGEEGAGVAAQPTAEAGKATEKAAKPEKGAKPEGKESKEKEGKSK